MSTEPPTSGHSDETAVTPVVPQAGDGEAPTYGPSQPSYGAEQPSYGSEQPSYGTTQPVYGTTQPTFGPPSGMPYGGGTYGESATYAAPAWGQATVPTPAQQPQPGQPTTGWWGTGPAPTAYGSGGQGGQGGQGGPVSPGVGAAHTSDTRSAANSFLSKLFDLSFTSFVTPSIIKIVYVIAMGLIAIGWLGYSVVGFARSPGLGLLFLVVIGPVVSLVYLVIVRISLELYLAVIRLAEDVRELKLKQE